MMEIFKNAGFKIKVKTNLHIANFLDVTFNLLMERTSHIRSQMTSYSMSTPHQTIHHRL